MILPHGVDGPALLLACALVGRVLLALLPPGPPGGHKPTELPATWAASHLLGSFALAFEAVLLRTLRVDPPAALFFAPWLLLALGRWLTLPGAMVPRRELPREPTSPLALALFTLAALAVVAAPAFAPAGRASGDAPSSTSDSVALFVAARSSALPGALGATALFRCADALALLALAAHGLAAARRAPVARAAVILMLAAVIAAAIALLPGVPLHLVLAVGAGAAFGIPWLRRADRRVGALSLLAFASAALLGPREAFFGLAGIVALRIHTAPPSRSALTIFAASLFVPATALGWLNHPADLETVLPAIGALSFVVVATALSTRHRLVLARGGADADPEKLGASMLRDALLLSILPPITRGEIASFRVLATALLPVLPIVVVEAGVLLGRAEIPRSAEAR